MSSGKSLGLDGFSPSFFKNFWCIIGKTVTEAIQHFFINGYLLKSMNHTFIALVPKTEKAHKVENFRPIALCNVVLKTITKILAKRLKPLLDNIVSPS